MTDAIVRNSAPPAPIAGLVLVNGYDGTVAIETILHAQLNGPGYNVTYRPARLRSGTLALVFATPAEAWAAVALLKTSHTYTLTADLAQVSMTFVLRPGELKPREGMEGGPVWLVDVPFQEVSP